MNGRDDMYLGKKSKTQRGGSKVEQYQIVQKYRVRGTPKMKLTIICGVGRVDDPKVREQLLQLCIAIAQEYELKVYDPSDPTFEMKPSMSAVFISLEDIREKATEKLELESTQVRKAMVELCQSIAKLFKLRVYDPTNPKSEEPPEIPSYQYEDIEWPIDTLRKAAQDLNDALGLEPIIDMAWSYARIIDSLKFVSEIIDAEDEITKDTFRILSKLGKLKKDTMEEFEAKFASTNNTTNKIDPVGDSKDVGRVPREQLERAVIDLNDNLAFLPKIDLWWNHHRLEESLKYIGINIGKDIKPINAERSISRKNALLILYTRLEENTWRVLYTLGSLSPEYHNCTEV